MLRGWNGYVYVCEFQLPQNYAFQHLIQGIYACLNAAQKFDERFIAMFIYIYSTYCKTNHGTMRRHDVNHIVDKYYCM